jgi:hypothetical protein
MKEDEPHRNTLSTIGRTAIPRGREISYGRRLCALRKFMVTLDEEIFDELQQVASRRDISIQELFRAVIIPDWIDLAVVEESRQQVRP